MNRKQFYDSIRQSLFGGKLSEKQVEGMEAILNEWDKRKFTDLRWLAYIMATVYHETAHTMQAIEEFGKGNGRKYGRKLKMSGVAYEKPDKIYYGRGWVQLTWYENYEKMGKLLKLDLLNNPELALKTDVSAAITFEGMTKGISGAGDFTGKSLEMYFNDTKDDPIGARKIINGVDKANTIALHHQKFLNALK
jgi:putative chitinase